MRIIEVLQVNKSFQNNKVVDNLSFNIEQGEIFGMMGPNGAGKTTTIRMLMDIIKPDNGRIKLFGEPINPATKDKIGYLPEERGLYKKLSVSESLVYLASLKSMPKHLAQTRAEELLKKVNMYVHRNKKTDELSHGMGQLIQFVATVLHNPDLIVFDEPFVALDPVNTQLLKDFIIDLKEQKKTIVLSTHMMNQVEELCDRVLMINKGRMVLYGGLGEVKAKYRNNSVFLEADRIPEELPGVTGRKDHLKFTELFLDGHTPPQDVLKAIIDKGSNVTHFEVSTPSLNEVFIQVVKEG
ncbi:MAG: ATP-binding cassette domain-containing protein [Dehalococcoidales bacterium]|nr:ATP-binding cassette domain-containing protein [Dehalococcoidales bacterium]